MALFGVDGQEFIQFDLYQCSSCIMYRFNLQIRARVHQPSRLGSEQAL